MSTVGRRPIRMIVNKNWHAALGEMEIDIVKACLRAAADGPFFPDWEFSAIFGFERSEVREVAGSWPVMPDPDFGYRVVKRDDEQPARVPPSRRGSRMEWMDPCRTNPVRRSVRRPEGPFRPQRFGRQATLIGVGQSGKR